MPIPFHKDVDTSFSTLTINQKFYVALAYQSIIEPHSTSMASEWIWKLNTQPKLKFFIWLLWCDSLPQRELLYKRRIIDTPVCLFCQSSPKTSLHTLRDCCKPVQVWALLDTSQDIWVGRSTQEWLGCMKSQSGEFRGLHWKSFFPSVYFEIWKEMNK